MTGRDLYKDTVALFIVYVFYVCIGAIGALCLFWFVTGFWEALQ